MKYLIPLSILLLLFPSTAGACWDVMEYTRAEIGFSGTTPATVMVTPDRSGDPLTAASLPDGTYVDASITLYLRDCYNAVIASFPQEDMWLESTDGGLVMCLGGSVADGSTNAEGVTTWTRPLAAGGYSETACHVLINGAHLTYPGSLPLQFNSPDISGDGTVNLTDVQLVATDFYSGYHFRSDFKRDGYINLSDLAKFAQALGATCP